MAVRKLAGIENVSELVARAIYQSDPNTRAKWDALHPGTQNILRTRADKVVASLDALLTANNLVIGNGRKKA